MAMASGRWVVACGGALALGACFSIDYGPEQAFLPRDVPMHAETEAELKVNLEEMFSEPLSVRINLNRSGERVMIERPAEAFVPTDVTHGFLQAGEIRIAWTLFAQAGVEGGRSGRPLVAFCGGNGFDRFNGAAVHALKILPYADVWMWDYPGYGDSSGQAQVADFETVEPFVSRHVASLAGDERDLVLWGHSMGGLLCSGLLEQTPEADGLVLETSARSINEMVEARTPWWSLGAVRVDVDETLTGYDVAQMAAEFDGQLLVIGGGRDKVLPVSLSRSLRESLSGHGERLSYVELPDGGHQDSFQQDGFEPAMRAFFSRVAAD